MVILRRTQKLANALPVSATHAAQSDTALGDWYVNRFIVDRRPLLLFVTSRGLLPTLLPARDVAGLPDRLPNVASARLRRLGIAEPIIDAEVASMSPVVVDVTIDRSVVGIMIDFAKSVLYHLKRGAWDQSTLAFVEARLARNPCHAGKRREDVVFPDQKAPELLLARSGAR